jgi:hypothetical protein
MINTTVGAEAASRYVFVSGSDQKMRFLAAPALVPAQAPQHCFSLTLSYFFLFSCREPYLLVGIGCGAALFLCGFGFG